MARSDGGSGDLVVAVVAVATWRRRRRRRRKLVWGVEGGVARLPAELFPCRGGKGSMIGGGGGGGAELTVAAAAVVLKFNLVSQSQEAAVSRMFVASSPAELPPQSSRHHPQRPVALCYRRSTVAHSGQRDQRPPPSGRVAGLLMNITTRS